VDAAPFDLAPDAPAAALCLHGLTGTPYEVRPLGEALAARGIRAFGPRLPGHGETPASLAGRRHDEWLDAVREHAGRLRERHERVFGVGLSMGGALALVLAAESRLDGLAVIGVPLRLRQPLAALLPLLQRIAPFPRKRAGSDIRDGEARGRHPGYDVMPLAAVRELQRLQRHLRRVLHQVRAPVLVAHGVHDRTARPADAEEIHATIASAEKQLLFLENSAHVVPVDRDGPALARAVAGFLVRQL
jgi:carboxylesterase